MIRERATEPRQAVEVSLLGRDAVFGHLRSRPDGLSDAEAAERRARFGQNRIEELPGPGAWQRLLAQFTHLFAVLLWVGSVLAFVVGEASVGVGIVVVILLNGLFGFVQENRAERAVAALKRLLPVAAGVVREGTQRDVPAADLVPGDLLVLDEGDRISADARLVHASDLRVDESSLTGEALPVHKVDTPEAPNVRALVRAHNMVFAGSTVIAGSARAVVTATGMRTEFGRIAALTQGVPSEPSPLQTEVARVGRRVAVLSVAMGAGFFAIGYLAAGLTLRNGAIFAIGIVLANVPEGLLPTMTLALAMGVQRMARRNALVKQLSSVETLGACTVICADKTGTITTNEMTVREVWASGRLARVTGLGYSVDGDLLVNGRQATDAETAAFLPVLRIGHLCNSARLPGRDPSPAGSRIMGDPTEGALLVAAAKAGLDRELDLMQRPVVRQLAFESKRKRMSTIHRVPPEEGHLLAYVKGAPRELLEHCVALLVDGQEVALTAELRTEIVAENDRMAESGLRVLAMAYRRLPPEAEPTLGALQPGAVEEALVFAGLTGMQDPPRDEVPDAVAKCRRAGIRIIMITGDYGLTARSVAAQVGIVGEGPVSVVDAIALDDMSDEDLQATLANRQVIFSRAAPDHKLRIVSALRQSGEVVAVTGDGVNDAPALKRADIGVAMGRTGTDVAREAADMVLVDDNFATIVAAVEEGRAIFDNMRKFIVYVFAHLSPEAIPFIFFALFHIPLPLTVMQILAIDLGTETLPALALGVERPEPDVMTRPPRRRDDPLLSAASLVRGYVFLGGIATVVVLAAFFLFLHQVGWSWGQASAPRHIDDVAAATIVFLGIVLMQVGNAFACRTDRVSVLRIGLFANRFLLWGIAFEVAFAAALIYTPSLQSPFGTTAVGVGWWLFLLAFVPVLFAAEECRKFIVRRRDA